MDTMETIEVATGLSMELKMAVAVMCRARNHACADNGEYLSL